MRGSAAATSGRPPSVCKYQSSMPSWMLRTREGECVPRPLVSSAPSSYVCHREDTAAGKLPSGTDVVKSSEKVRRQPGRSPVGALSPDGVTACGDGAPAAVIVTLVRDGADWLRTLSTARRV